MSNLTQTELNDQLINALRNIDFKKMIELIQKGANVNQTDDDGYTVLHIFCYFENIEGVKLCISKNADVNVQTKFFKNTPLGFAVRSGNYESCKLLLEAGADPTIKDDLGKDALWYANHNKKFIYLIKSYLPKKK